MANYDKTDPENEPLTPEEKRDQAAQDRWFEQKRRDQEKEKTSGE